MRIPDPFPRRLARLRPPRHAGAVPGVRLSTGSKMNDTPSKPVLPYRPGKDDTRRVAAKDVVIASIAIGALLLMTFFIGLLLISAVLWRGGGGLAFTITGVFGSCLIALASLIVIRRRLSRRPMQ